MKRHLRKVSDEAAYSTTAYPNVSTAGPIMIHRIGSSSSDTVARSIFSMNPTKVSNTAMLTAMQICGIISICMNRELPKKANEYAIGRCVINAVNIVFSFFENAFINSLKSIV